MKLAIISHTPHYLNENNITGWGPTIREINHLTEVFEEVYHAAPLHKENAPNSSLSYATDKINFIPLKPYGGEKFKDKVSIITTAFYNLKKIKTVLDKVDWVQFRAPTAMGLYVLPYLSIRSKPQRWVKYAGNWQMENPPISYRFQKWWLENNFQKSKVTINGKWENQKEHILSFENPCMSITELENAKEIALKKNFEGKLTLCFAGALLKSKGVDLILKALKKISHREMIEQFIFAGDSDERNSYEKIASEMNIKITFKSFLNRTDLDGVYEKSHLIILPSKSEGFPKVIAEAAAYGCVPVVSDVSSIGQYFNVTNGFLLERIDAEELAEQIDNALSDRIELKKKSLNCLNVAGLFTFENYIKNLNEKVLNAH